MSTTEIPAAVSGHSRSLGDDATPQRSCCARFVQYISDGCSYIWEGLIHLINRIRDCFCRSGTPDQPEAPPLESNRVEDLTLKPPVSNMPLPSSTASREESSFSPSSTSAPHTPEEIQPAPTSEPQIVSPSSSSLTSAPQTPEEIQPAPTSEPQIASSSSSSLTSALHIPEEIQPAPTSEPQIVSSSSTLPPLPPTVPNVLPATSLPSIVIPPVEEITVAKMIVTRFCDFVVKSYDAKKKEIRCFVEERIPLRVTGNAQKLQSALEGEKRAIWDKEICSYAERQYPLRDNMNHQELTTILGKQSEFIAKEREKLDTREEYIAKEIERSLPIQRYYQNKVIYQQGLRLFNCLSPKDQLFMLKKLQSAGLVSTWRIFVSQLSDAIQEKVATRIDKLKTDALDALAKAGIDQNIIRTRRIEMEAELVKYWNNQSALYSTAWDEIIQSTLLSEMQLLAAQEPPLADYAHFVQQIIYKALNHEALDTHLTSFDRFSLKDQLWIIEILVALTGNRHTMHIIPPVCIVLLVNKLPQKTREAMKSYPSDKQDLFVEHQLKPVLTLQDIQDHIFPAICRIRDIL